MNAQFSRLSYVDNDKHISVFNYDLHFTYELQPVNKTLCMEKRGLIPYVRAACKLYMLCLKLVDVMFIIIL